MKRIAFALLFLATSLSARVTSVEITTRADLGPHLEKLVGKVHYALDPKDPHDAVIVDLDKAPRDANGEVEFTADLYVIRPKAQRNGTLFVEISNRGGKGFLSKQDPSTEGDIHDRFLFDRGYTVVWIGWQFDVPSGMKLYAPVAHGVTGRVRSDWVVDQKTDEHTVSHIIVGYLGGIGYPTSNPNDRSNTLTERDAPRAERHVIPHSRWRFVDPMTIHLDGGFVPGKIYEAIYVAKDPAVVGCGLAAIRDFVSWSKYDPRAITASQRAYGFGISQSGRFLRHFLYQGFNADEQGRQVFDAMDIHVAGSGRGSFNHRFAQPSRDSEPLSPLFYPNDIFPFTDLPTTDPLSGVTAGLLDRAFAEKVVPKIFYTNTAYEYWSRGESLCHTTPDSTRDMPIPLTSRIYFLAGTAHVPGPFPPRKLNTQNLVNPSSYWPLLHAMFDALDVWVRNGTEPPPSNYPHIADGTLVRVIPSAAEREGSPSQAAGGFLAAFAGRNDKVTPYGVYKMELGPKWNRGMTQEPPKVVGIYTPLVPQVGPDGNEISGIHMPWLAVPLATLTGWNLRDPSVGFPDRRQNFLGSYLSFSKEQIGRLYRDENDYLGRYTAATLKLIDERFLAPDDLNATLRYGQRLWAYASEAAQ